MRLRWVLILAVFLGGCAPTAFTVATLATSGVAYVATGKSVSDLTLSAMVQGDCQMFRLLQGEPVCRPQRPGEGTPAVTTLAQVRADPAYDAGPRPGGEVLAAGLVPAGETAPAPGPDARPRAEEVAVREGVYVLRSGEARVVAQAAALRCRTARLDGFSEDSELFALLQDDGTLEIFVHDRTRGGAEPDLRLVFTIEGYGRDPDAFAGLWLNGSFHFVTTIMA